MFSEYRILFNLLNINKKYSTTIKHCGIELLRNPRINRGTAFTLRERQLLGLQGILPPAETDQISQMNRIMHNLQNSCENDLKRYNFLMTLQDRNENLFFKTIMENIEYCMPLIYTPTVGQACLTYGLGFRRSRGLYITSYDKANMLDILDNWTETDVKIIVVTDGERILGLGDLGAYGTAIPIGKLNLYIALGGIHPEQCLPILLDFGTNNETLINDPNYIGLRKNRIKGIEYDDFIDHFLLSVVEKFGPNTLIQFEDFANHNAFKFLNKYKGDYCFFNDDIQGTAAVTLGGIMASMRLLGSCLSDQKYLFAGAGEASIGIANLLITALIEEGLNEEEALSKVFIVDSKGLVVKERHGKNLSDHKLRYAQNVPYIEHLVDVVESVKPTTLIGTAAIGKVFDKDILSKMAQYNDRPIIFSLGNPIDKSECTAEEAYRYTNGKCLFASGSQFCPVTLSDGTIMKSSVSHNAYLFPGIGFAVTAACIQPITNEMFLVAAKTLAEFTKIEDLQKGSLYPNVADIPKLSMLVSKNCVEYAYKNKLASHYPEPENKEAFLQRRRYQSNYPEAVPFPYSWPPGVTDRV